ncbi:MAG: phenylalanine--tRNA ligase subunit beta [Cyclobacteriaceae bacterium]
MKISLSWLRQYIDLPEPAEEIGDLLTMSGLEVEGLEEFETVKGGLAGLVIGKVVDCNPHPNADKLKSTSVDIGTGQLLKVVCGAPNVAAGQKVVVAPVGTTIFPTEGDPFKIKKAKIRGEVSEGMICAEDEIGLGTGHEGIMVLETDLPLGTAAADYFEIETDHVFEIGLTPNRADAASHLGTARDLKALLERPITLPALDAFKIDQSGAPIEVIVENAEACPRYSGIYFKEVTVGPSPTWLQNRLLSVGLSPINNIVDITNFVMHELGQPMHAFDADQIAGGKIIVKSLDEGSSFITLDEKSRKLKSYDLMICDGDSNGLCIAGVFGGVSSGVTEKTKNVFLESAYFSPEYIRKTAQHHGLKTDASFRYERGTDPLMTVKAVKRAAILIRKITGATIASDIVDVYPKQIEAWPVAVTFKQINRLIGQSIPKDQVKKILNLLDIEVKDESPDGFIAIVPPYRVDVKREADVIEEILRIYGYNNITLDPSLHSDYLAEFPQNDSNRSRFGLGKLLASVGFSEIYTNSLTKPGYVEATSSLLHSEENVVILNKLSEDLGVLRQELLFSGLEVIAYNVNHKQTNLKLFEVGKTYRYNSGAGTEVTDQYTEQDRLALYMSGLTENDTWVRSGEPSGFHDIYGAVDRILKKFKIDTYQSNSLSNALFSYGLSLESENSTIAQLGEVQNKVCKLAGVRQKVFYADIDWEFLLKQSKDNILYQEVSKYPEVRRDLSLVVDDAISYQTIEQIALQTERRLLKRINVFDVYRGEKIDQKKKAYALSFILQDQKATLTDKAIDRCMNRLMQSFEKELNATIRK